jgi:hypothetical protein
MVFRLLRFLSRKSPNPSLTQTLARANERANIVARPRLPRQQRIFWPVRPRTQSGPGLPLTYKRPSKKSPSRKNAFSAFDIPARASNNSTNTSGLSVMMLSTVM